MTKRRGGSPGRTDNSPVPVAAGAGRPPAQSERTKPGAPTSPGTPSGPGTGPTAPNSGPTAGDPVANPNAPEDPNAIYSESGKLIRLTPDGDGCSFALRGQSKDFSIVRTHENYNAMFSLLLAAGVNGYFVTVRYRVISALIPKAVVSLELTW